MDNKSFVITNTALLSRPSKLITPEVLRSDYVAETVKKLKHTAKCIEMFKSRQIIGLSAIQIDEPVAIGIVRNRFDKWITLVNPMITWKSEGKTKENCETCLSFPNRPFVVTRYNKIKVRFINKHGKVVTRTFRGKVARRVQHEIDHMNGIIPTKKQFERGQIYK